MQSLVASHRRQLNAVAGISDRLKRQRLQVDTRRSSGEFSSHFNRHYLARQESNQQIRLRRRNIIDHWQNVVSKNLHDSLMSDRVTLNISGLVFETYWQTLMQFPNTLLGNPDRLKEFYDEDKNQYFLPRNRLAFDGILYFYQSGGSVYRPQNVSVNEFYEEMMFFDLGEEALQEFVQRENFCVDCVADTPELTQDGDCKRIKFDSETATAGISLLAIILWIALMLAETEPVLQKGYTLSALMRVQLGFAVFFTAEFIFYAILALKGKKSMVKFLTVMDLVSIPPFYIIAILYYSDKLADTWYIRFIHFLRILKIFQLGRHIEGLRIYARTFTTSFNDIMMMVFLLALGVVLFSSGAYYTQGGSHHVFHSIPDAFWYSIVTMTTVGYGDIVPKSDMGKFIGAACALTGLLVLALMVPIIAANFEKHYQEVNFIKKHTPCKRLRAAAAAKQRQQAAHGIVMTSRIAANHIGGFDNHCFDSSTTEVALEETDINAIDHSNGVKHGLNAFKSVGNASDQVSVQAGVLQNLEKVVMTDEEGGDELKICASPRSDLERMDLYLDDNQSLSGSYQENEADNTRL